MIGIENIWDGEEFRQVTAEEAKRLVKEDKAQIMDGTVFGNELKYRHQFTGYHTREMRAEQPPVRVQPAPPEPEGKVEQPDWRSYKAKAKKALGKDRVTKAQVEGWMKSEGIIE